MFISALQSYAVAIIITLIIAQYGLAVFCLLKLAYFDIDKKNYIIWNLIILLAVFVGGIVFLVYYNKHPEKRLRKNTDAIADAPSAEIGNIDEKESENSNEITTDADSKDDPDNM